MKDLEGCIVETTELSSNENGFGDAMKYLFKNLLTYGTLLAMVCVVRLHIKQDRFESGLSGSFCSSSCSWRER